MNLIEKYQNELETGEIQPDPGQSGLLAALNGLCEELNQPRSAIAQWLLGRPKAIKGLYIWGGVGIGKTYLMDLFFETLSTKRKCRMHFHVFMKQVHDALKVEQGAKDPLLKIAKDFAAKYQVLCFDEFFVCDIADAMLLGGLLQALFARGITMVATSNVAPDDLYRNGLQRSRFLPAIEALKHHMQLFHANSETDHRLRELQQAGVYFSPLNKDSKQSMQACYQLFTHGHGAVIAPLVIEGREIKTIAQASSVIWFDFNEICNVPRSQLDYIEIAKTFATVFISGMPALSEQHQTQVLYLIHLVDVFYDAGVKLILQADTAVEMLYPEGRLSFEFQRTRSRLLEMQSTAYLHRPHQYAE